MMLVFYVIDLFNNAMHFIGNQVFNTLLLIYSLLVIVTSIWTIADHRRGRR